MEKALIALILSSSDVFAHVKTSVRWNRRAQTDTADAIVLHRIGGVRDYRLAGASGLVQSRVQADCYGQTYRACDETAAALIAFLNSYSGTFEGVQFQRIEIDDERGTNETENDGRHLFSKQIDLIIWHDE